MSTKSKALSIPCPKCKADAGAHCVKAKGRFAETHNERIEAYNNELQFFVHHCPGIQDPWLAIHKESAFKALSGYNLSDNEKKDVFYLMAGYCRLLDEAGLIHYGKTKAEVLRKAGQSDKRRVTR